MTKFILIISSSLLILVSCTKAKTPLPLACADDTSYSKEIRPLIDQNCSVSGCHDASASGGYDLTGYSAVSTNASIILSSMRAESGLQPMPQGAPQLPDSLINKFDCWKANGTKNN